MNAAVATAAKLASALNDASPERPYGWSARAWHAPGKDWARVYVRANSRSARQLGHFFVDSDGSVKDYEGKMRGTLRGVASAAGFGPEDWA